MVILVLEPTVMIGYSAVNKNRKEVNHICIKEKLMHQKQAQPSKSKESFGFLKTATWRRDEGRFMSPLSILCVLLLVYTASTEVVNEIRGTNEDENTVDITEEKRMHPRNPYSWMKVKRARNPYSWMLSEQDKRARNPYSWMAIEKDKRALRFSDDVYRQPRNPYSWMYTMFDKRARNPYSWMNE